MNQAYWGDLLDHIREQPQQSRYEQQQQQQPQQQPQLPLPPGGRLPPIQSARQPDPELQERLSKKSDTKKSKNKYKSRSRSRISTKRKNKNRRQTRK
jgi:hypothetical protein